MGIDKTNSFRARRNSVDPFGVSSSFCFVGLFGTDFGLLHTEKTTQKLELTVGFAAPDSQEIRFGKVPFHSTWAYESSGSCDPRSNALLFL